MYESYYENIYQVKKKSDLVAIYPGMPSLKIFFRIKPLVEIQQFQNLKLFWNYDKNLYDNSRSLSVCVAFSVKMVGRETLPT